jgi:tRNA uridine 5-carbamoylmethylation protein Kti12
MAYQIQMPHIVLPQPYTASQTHLYLKFTGITGDEKYYYKYHEDCFDAIEKHQKFQPIIQLLTCLSKRYKFQSSNGNNIPKRLPPELWSMIFFEFMEPDISNDKWKQYIIILDEIKKNREISEMLLRRFRFIL